LWTLRPFRPLWPFDTLNPIGPIHLSSTRIVSSLPAMFTRCLISAIEPSNFTTRIRPAILSTIGLPILTPILLPIGPPVFPTILAAILLPYIRLGHTPIVPPATTAVITATARPTIG
jgi:hypothetical protein